MKVKELKKALSKLPNDMEIWLQRDPEGNGYSPLEGADSEVVIADEDSIFSLNWSAGDCCLEEDEWEELKKKPRSLILYPRY